jgi:hypothetical protein
MFWRGLLALLSVFKQSKNPEVGRTTPSKRRQLSTSPFPERLYFHQHRCENLKSRIFWSVYHIIRRKYKVNFHFQPYAPAAFTPQEIFLELTSLRGWADSRAKVRPEGLWQWKIPIDSSGIEPATFRQSTAPPRTPLLLQQDAFCFEVHC